MASRRTLKAAQAIREVVAMSLLTDLKDPRVNNVTITGVEVSGDMRTAKVLFTVLGGEVSKERMAMAGLTSAAGFLQQKCARRIDTRYTPRLQFAIDEGVKNLAAVSALLEAEKRKKREEQPESDASDAVEADEFEADGIEAEEDAGEFDEAEKTEAEESDSELNGAGKK